MPLALFPVNPSPCDEQCIIQPDYPSVVLSNGTVNITGPNSEPSFSGFSTAGVEFTAYTSLTVTENGSVCATSSTIVSLKTPFFVPTPTSQVREFFGYVAETPFAYDINPGCSVSQFTALTASSLFNLVSTVPITRSSLPSTHSFSSPVPSLLPSPPSTTAASTASLPPASDPPQNPSPGPTETKKLTVGLVVAITVLIIFITIGISSFCIMRRRRRRKNEEVAASTKDKKKDESQDAHLYFQQKVELDDEQRRHEMEAVDLRYELEGEDRLHEMPEEDEQRRPDCGGRQELRGEEHAKELDTSQLSVLRGEGNFF